MSPVGDEMYKFIFHSFESLVLEFLFVLELLLRSMYTL